MAKESNVSLFWFGLVAVVVIIVSLNGLLSRQQSKELPTPPASTETIASTATTTPAERVVETTEPSVPLSEGAASISPSFEGDTSVEESPIPVVIIDTSQTIKPVPDPIVTDVIVTETAPAAIPVVTDVIVSDTPPPPEVPDNVQEPGSHEWGVVSLPEGGVLLFPPVDSAAAMPSALAQHIHTLLSPSGWQLTEEGDQGWILWSSE
jgi:cytoskeletal protein RodZ